MRYRWLHRSSALLAFTLALSAGPYAATASAQVPAEIGIGIGHVSTIDLDVSGDAWHSTSVDFRAAVPFTPHWSVEGIATVGRRYNSDRRITEGVYGVLLRRHGTVVHGFAPFVACGVLGTYRQTTAPTWSELQAWPLLLPTVGAGARQQISPRVAVHGEIDGMFLPFFPYAYGMRATVSLSMRIGHEPH
ncbi:MAG TPA: hypothetical protein VKI43_18460 [Vicinamibacterales bacterium]|nr:hypothetical protein [Vicinamibacterales bacterium]